MSFSSETKSSLCNTPQQLCCRRAILAGMLVFANVCTEDKIKLITENKDVAELFMKLLKDLCSVKAYLYVSDKKTGFDADGDGKYKSYKMTVVGKKEIAKMRSLFLADAPSFYRINPALFKCGKCKTMFVRGAFLSSGTITNPTLSYHCEISTSHMTLGEEMAQLLQELNVPPKNVARRSNTVLYYKGSERIIDLLQLLGAQTSVFKLMNSKINKEIRNNINRIVNSETANIEKSIAAAQQSLEAINHLEKIGALDTLPESLKQVAQLRRDNPSATLAQLAAMADPPLSKSGINHRLQKIIETRNKIDG